MCKVNSFTLQYHNRIINQITIEISNAVTGKYTV